MLKPLTVFSSARFRHSVVFNSLWPHGLQHARLLCPSPTPRVYSNSCPSSQWCHPTISFFVVPAFNLFPASGSFPMSQLFASGDQSIGVSDSASVLPVNIQDWFPLGWTVSITTNYGKFLKRWQCQTTIPASWETGTQDKKKQNRKWDNRLFKIGKGVHQCRLLSLCLFNLYAEYIMQNVRLDEAQARNKIARRNIKNWK